MPGPQRQDSEHPLHGVRRDVYPGPRAQLVEYLTETASLEPSPASSLEDRRAVRIFFWYRETCRVYRKVDKLS